MLHLRVICPPNVTDAVLDSLRSIPGLTHVIVLRDAPGDPAAAVVWEELRRWDLVRRAMLALGIGFPVAMLIAVVGVLLGEWAGLISEMREIDQVDFIYQVGPFSLIIALLAGAAGMLSLTSAKSAALVGVFISVTTVPAAAFAVVAATDGAWETVAESSGQLLVNLVGIVVAAVIVLLMHTHRYRGAPNRPLS